MKVSNTSKRLKELMETRNLRQVDILNLTKPVCEQYDVKMNKSDISQYVSGKNEPAQDKLIVLGAALNVSEAWLMGFDVPMEREYSNKWKYVKESFDKIDAFEAELKVLGWKTEFLGCNDWELIENGGMGLNDEGEMVDGGTGHPAGCSLPNKGYTKCENCSLRNPHYIFSNGNISFNVSLKEYDLFLNDVELFYKKRLQRLMLKSSMQIFEDDQEVQAAHERTDIEVTDEMRKHDDDLMDGEW